MSKPLLLLLACATFAPLAACVYDDSPPRRLASEPEPSHSAAPPAADAPAPPLGGGTPPTTMLVEVDTDQTMNAVGGDGVGVFVEYAAGGHWHVWWTCDSNQTAQKCDFSITASVASGKIENLNTEKLEGGFATKTSNGELAATSSVTTEVRGITFDTAAGAVITLEASVGGLADGSFLFFVQNGEVNGGFTGKLTNPLQLQGTRP